MKLTALVFITLLTTALHAQDLHKIDLITYGGLPAADSLDENLQILYNSAFITGYSNDLRNPMWTAYRFGNISGKYEEEEPKTEDWERPHGFKVDQRTSARVKHEDYIPGYDRGHMAPNSGILEQYGQMAQLETFLMSNITPQKANLNRNLWANLEKEIRTKISQDDTQNKEVVEVYVLCGPIFETSPPQRFPSGVAIPTSFYCIISFQRGYLSTIKAIALKVPQDVTTTNIIDFVTTVDEIERLTNLNFFPALSVQKQKNLESKKRNFLLEDLN